MSSRTETLNYLRDYIKEQVRVGQSVVLTEASRKRLAYLIDCSPLELDVAITQLRASKDIIVQRQMVVEVKC